MKKKTKVILGVLGALFLAGTVTAIVRFATSEYAYGETIEFGNYPQKLVTDASLISTLDGLTPDSDGYVTSGDVKYLKTRGSGENGYSASTTYYFEVEPITWKYYSGTLICEKIIDASAYYTDWLNNRINNTTKETIYPNNYMYSTVRAYLNGLDGSNYYVNDFSGKGFIDKAFTADE